MAEAQKLVARAGQIALTTQSGRAFAPQYIFFSRSGFSEPARLYAKEAGAQLVDLVELDTVLAQATR